MQLSITMCSKNIEWIGSRQMIGQSRQVSTCINLLITFTLSLDWSIYQIAEEVCNNLSWFETIIEFLEITIWIYWIRTGRDRPIQSRSVRCICFFKDHIQKIPRRSITGSDLLRKVETKVKNEFGHSFMSIFGYIDLFTHPGITIISDLGAHKKN